jgi:ribosome maturation factor RimP
MASPTHQATALALKDSLADIVAQQGADLEDVEVTAAGRRTRIRVVVDADEGIDLDAIATISQAVSAVLDDPQRVGGSLEVIGSSPYTLEVTSPGVDRPLTQPRHWRRNVSRLVEITLRENGGEADPEGAQRGGQTMVGRITAVTETDVTVEVDGQSRDVALADIARAMVQIEFRRPQEGR